MVKEVYPNIFQLKIPLPNLPLKHLNAYLVRAEDRVMLIDTGLNCEDSWSSLLNQMGEAGVKPENLTDIFLTHFHVDHVGLVLRLKKISPKIRILLHGEEIRISREASSFPKFLEGIKLFHLVNGVPEKVMDRVIKNHPAYNYSAIYREISNSSVELKDGEKICFGREYCFRVVLTAGHSPGHLCLYEPKLGILISGDHLLPTITPNIFLLKEKQNPLKDYFKSLEKVGRFNVERILPAHEDVFTNFWERICQLKERHVERSKEILERLKEEKLSAYELASRVSWDVDYGSWEEFPIFQKYLAVGEVLAHLKFLEEKGFVRKIKENGIIVYQRVEG